jgi:hypothetical protein
MAELALDSGGNILNDDGGGIVADGGWTSVVGCTDSEGLGFAAGDDVRELSSPCSGGGGGGEGSFWLVSGNIDGSASGDVGSVSERISAVLGRSERDSGALEPGASKSGGGFSS